jgi:hypothetical protein
MFRGLVPVLTCLLALAAAPASAQTPAQGPPPAPAPQPTPTPAAQADEAPAFKISGLVFGDYYYVAANHRDELEGQNGFWLRRVYFTYDQTLSRAFSMRFRLELNSKGDFESTGVNTPYLKDAWLKWTFGSHALVFGLAPTPQIDFIDNFQGYRSLEKPPIDLYRWDASRDLGLVLQGSFGKAQRTSYTLQLGNGSGTGSEVDQSKSARAQLVHRFAAGLVIEGYADWQDRPDGHDISTLEAFVGWQEPKWRASLQYGRQQRREAAPGGLDQDLEFLSAFAVVQVTPKVAVLGRLDRNFDEVPNGETIDYMPFSETARALFGYAGVDVTLAKTVHLIPNLEWTTYGQSQDGTTPASDLVPRVTLFFSW